MTDPSGAEPRGWKYEWTEYCENTDFDSDGDFARFMRDASEMAFYTISI